MLLALLAAALISVPPSSTSQARDEAVVFAPPVGEVENYRCDPRPCLIPQPQSAHVYEGQFGVRLQPTIYCIRAPCPQAGTTVTLPDGSSVRVGRIGYARGTPANLRVQLGRVTPAIRYEGKVWITLDRKLAIIAPTAATVPTPSPPPRPIPRPPK